MKSTAVICLLCVFDDTVDYIIVLHVTLQFVGKYDVVVNCAGFGSCELLNDKKMIPIRGHLFRVR